MLPGLKELLSREEAVLVLFCQDMAALRGPLNQPRVIDVDTSPLRAPCKALERDELLYRGL